MKRVLTVFGTRPEAIKLMPVLRTLKQDERFKSRCCVTGQHREMLDQVLRLFEIKPDYDLEIMKKNQTLNEVSARILVSMRSVLRDFKPDIVLVHGDTATTFATALAAHYEKIQVGHIEAGLRSGDILSPWPEEANRRLTAVISNYHFTPTQSSKENLLRENICQTKIYVTGNTVIEALELIKKKLDNDSNIRSHFEKKFNMLSEDKKLILVTGHRRENFGEGFKRVCDALLKVAQRNPEIQILYPVHLNPEVRNSVHRILTGHENIYLIEPQQYLEFVYLMDRSFIIITDSGGIQEEAPSLGKPVLVTRDTTERPEAVSAGTVKLVGTDGNLILKSIEELLCSPEHYRQMSFAHNPYGDGQASQRILEVLAK